MGPLPYASPMHLAPRFYKKSKTNHGGVLCFLHQLKMTLGYQLKIQTWRRYTTGASLIRHSTTLNSVFEIQNTKMV